MKTLAPLLLILVASLATFSQCKDTSAQRAAFAKLTNAEKVKLWDAHLIDYVAKHPLKPEQVKLIEFARTRILPTIYDRRYDKRLLDSWRQELKENFSLKEGSEIFEQLSGIKGDTASLAGDCTCSTWWTFCDSGMTCSTSCVGCGNCIRIIDCGPFWAFQCNGKCSPVLNEFKDN
jgi:hypothetical protein